MAVAAVSAGPGRTRRQLISCDEAFAAEGQHATQCMDCPWGRGSLNRWLGGGSIDNWLTTAHRDHLVECHVLTGAQCAGVAIYRANVCKRTDFPLLRLPANKALVFATPREFRAHHSRFPASKPERDERLSECGSWAQALRPSERRSHFVIRRSLPDLTAATAYMPIVALPASVQPSVAVQGTTT